MTKINYFLIMIGIVLMSSCGTVTKLSVFRPDDIRLNVDMGDLEYIGETEISVSYSTYLGFISITDKVNGEDYSYFEKKIAKLAYPVGRLFGGKLNKAAYKVLEDYPEATYFMPVCTKKEINRLFLGREVTRTAKIRAYKFKN